jgi:hypothetical protein
MDLEPLERTRDIQTFNITAVALVRVGQTSKDSEDSDEAPPQSMHGRDVSIDYNRLRSDDDGRTLMRVHMGDTDSKEAVVLRIARTATLEELLLQVWKKKPNLNQQIHQWTFVHMDPKRGSLELSSRVQDVGRDEVRLQKKLPDLSKPKVVILPSEGLASPDEFVFDRETACRYTEFVVIKTNAQGKKQRRVMGIDQHMISNKKCVDEEREHKKFGSKLIAKMRTGVAVAARPIASISSATMLKNHPDCFAITYKEKNQLISREYRTETSHQSAEIVARIRYLMNLCAEAGGSSGQ